MRHRRGVDLVRGDRNVYTMSQEELAYLTFDRLEQWYDLGARCGRCEREGWLDRWELSRKWSPGAVFLSLVPRLRCLKCGSRQGNQFIIRQLPR